jgi:hypothetical protein
MKISYIFQKTDFDGGLQTWKYSGCNKYDAIDSALQTGWSYPRWWQWWRRNDCYPVLEPVEFEENFSSCIPSTQTPISVNDRLPGPDDFDMDGRCWWFDSYYEMWKLDSRWTYCNGELMYTHWLPHYAIQNPSSNKNK